MNPPDLGDTLAERYPIPDHPETPIHVTRLALVTIQAQAFAAGVAWQKQHQKEES